MSTSIIKQAVDLLGLGDSYSYDPDDTDQNVVMLFCTNELMQNSTVDPLRKELGFTFSPKQYIPSAAGAAPGAELESRRGNISKHVDDLRDFTVAHLSTNSKYIDSIEVMPSMITPVYSEAIVPNFKIPVRLYANEANTSNDALWRIFFTGGSYGEQEFPSLIDLDTVFNDYSFTYANSYTSLYAQSIGIAESCPNINSIRSHYLSYNLNIRDYQEWVKKQRSPLNLPNVYVLQTVALASREREDLRDPDSYSPSYLSPIRQLSPSLQLTLANSSSTDNVGLFYGDLHEKLLDMGDALSDRLTNKDWFESIYTPKIRASKATESQKMSAAQSQRNIILSDEYYTSWIQNDPLAELMEIFPYYNKISWPRHTENPGAFGMDSEGYTSAWSAASDMKERHSAPLTLESTYDGLHTERDFIKNTIADHGFSSKFLETLKDIHNGQFPFLRFGNKELNTEYSGRELSDTSEYATHTQRTIITKPYRTLDLIKMLQMMYNTPDAAINDDYTFVGPADASYQTTYEDNRLYRYYDNKNLVGVLDHIYGTVRTMYDLTADKYTWNAEDRPKDWENTPEQAARVLEYVFNPNLCHAETLAYRIEKTGASPGIQGDYATSEVLQDYWIFNSSDAPDNMEIYDTQIKYGEDYTYKVYAYVVVLGKKYMYRDFRLTKQIGQIDSGPDGAGEGAHDQAPVAPDGDPEYYCVQFYEPLSGEYADQLFNVGTADWQMESEYSALLRPDTSGTGVIDSYSTYGTGFASAITYDSDAGSPYLNISSALTSQIETLRGDSERSALAQRNEFATNQVDLTEHPHLADFHILLEPCLKIIEVPLFKKKLKVLDSPANDMVAIPFQYMDASKRIGFNMRYENFNERRPYPTSISTRDIKRSHDYQYSRDIIPGHNVTEESKAPQRYIEIYRTDSRPTSFADFENKLVDTIDLQIEDSNYTYSDTFYRTKISTNKKYYYVFRFVTENLVPGHMSQVIQCELIDDGSYIYSKFDVLADSLGEAEVHATQTKSCKKIFQIEPNISQTALDTTMIDFQNTATEEVENLRIGEGELDLIWDNTFKIRLTSKKTSRQLDFNITFELKNENRINYERGGSKIHLHPLKPSEFYEKVTLATGLDHEWARGSSTRPGLPAGVAEAILDTLMTGGS